MELQDQIYVGAAVLGTTSFLLLVLICVLFGSVNRLRKRVRESYNDDLLQNRGFCEYKGADIRLAPSHQSLPPIHLQPSNVQSSMSYNNYPAPPIENSNLMSSPRPSVIKSQASVGIGHAQGYGKSYDNSGYERDSRDITAGGVRVLPSSNNYDHQARRNNYDHHNNSGYY